MSAHYALDRSELARCGRCELETRRNEMLAHARFEVVPAFENLARLGREFRAHPPLILNAAQALVPEDRCTEVLLARSLRTCANALERRVDRGVDRLEAEVCTVEIQHDTPRCLLDPQRNLFTTD
jgi:hypothetical protein